jgi:hypothetical protein
LENVLYRKCDHGFLQSIILEITWKNFVKPTNDYPSSALRGVYSRAVPINFKEHWSLLLTFTQKALG